MKKNDRQHELKQTKLTPEGWVYIIILSFIAVGAVLRNINMLIVMTGMMVAPLIYNWRTGVMRLKTIRVKRLPPERIHAGQLVSIPWHCENRSQELAGWNVTVHDVLRCNSNAFGEAQDEKRGWFSKIRAGVSRWANRWILRRKFAGQDVGRVRFVRVGPRSTELASYRAFFPQRGLYEAGPAEVSTSYPFGLVNCRIVEPKKSQIYVAPAIGKLHPTWERRVASIAVGSQSIERRRGMEEDEFYALRKWRSGDNLKNVHWRTSAKFGYPMVKQFDQQNNRDFAMLLDLCSFDEDSFENCERILSFAATAMLQIGNDVQGQIAVAICGETSQEFYGRNRKEVNRTVMRELAVAASGRDPQIRDSIATLANCVSQGTPVYCFSSRKSPEWFSYNGHEHESKTQRQSMSSLVELVRWIEVPSDEFSTLFTTKEEDMRPASELAEKWAVAQV